MTHPSGEFAFAAALSTAWSRRRVARAFGRAGWDVRRCTWTDFEVCSAFAELVIESEGPILLHGHVAGSEANIGRIFALLRSAGIAHEAEWYDGGDEPRGEVRWGFEPAAARGQGGGDVMRRAVATTILAGLPFGLAVGLLAAISTGEPWILPVAAVAGLVFGGLLAAFMGWQRGRMTLEAQELDGERLLRQGPANHMRGLEGVGGWLYLTERRLLFRPHRFNVQVGEASIPLAEVRAARAAATAWIVPNGLHVETARGVDRFVVEDRRAWVEAIDRARSGPMSSAGDGGVA